MRQDFKFAFVSNSEAIAKAVRDYAASQGVEIAACLASMEQALPVAEELLDSGVEVILGGGGTGKLLRQRLRRPVVTIARSHLDLLKALRDARKHADYIAVTSYGDMTEGLDLLAELLKARLRPVVFSSSAELAAGISRAVAEGVGCVVGGGVCREIAAGQGCPGLVVIPGPQVIQRALEEARNIAASVRRDRGHAAWLGAALESLHEGIIGVDNKGAIVLSNSKAADFLETSAENRQAAFAGFLETVNINKTLASGRDMPDGICSFAGRDLVANIRPIQVNGNIEGALAAFRPAAYLRGMGQKLSKHAKSRGFTARYGFEDLAGESEAMRRLRERAARYAQTDANVFIHGETGSGKELLAHAIHRAGPRAARPFVAVNCAALPESLLESELFGYEEGSFTGARKGGKEGVFMLADNGTIFLDEVADISPMLQVRLLRVLESREILQVGGSRLIPVSVRILSSSWKNLGREARAGRFRADLYYRLNTLNLTLPPLRERREDLPAICARLLRRAGSRPEIVSGAGYALLAAYSWPGNVRELDALLRRYVLLLQGDKPDDRLLEDLLREIAAEAVCPDTPASAPEYGGKAPAPEDETLRKALEKYERELLARAMEAAGGDRKRAARRLGVSANTLWRKLKSL